MWVTGNTQKGCLEALLANTALRLCRIFCVLPPVYALIGVSALKHCVPTALGGILPNVDSG